MAIIGVTHSKDGETLIRRSVTTKVAIGRGPDERRKYPEKLDHFIFLKKAQGGDSVEWVDDEKMNSHYKQQNGNEDPTEIVIILLDDDIDHVFRTEYAWWVKTGKKCHGDGESAERQVGDAWVKRQICANSGKCEEYESGECKPSADLYFMLADFPSLGTACRLHTSSYQSIREIYSALNDLRNMMGGRLLGLPVKLFVRPEKNVFENKEGKKQTGTKWVLGLELRGDSLPKLLENVSESAKVFADLRKVMQGSRIEILEDDNERAPEISGEFHVAANAIAPAQLPAASSSEKEVSDEIKAFHERAEKAGLNKANRHFLLSKCEGDVKFAMVELDKMNLSEDGPRPEVTTGPKPKAKKGSAAEAPAPPEKPVEKKYGF